MPVIAAIDRDDDGGQILGEAAALADAFDLPLRVVHVMDRSTFLDLERSTVESEGKSVPLDEIRAMAKEIAAEAMAENDVDGEAVGLVGEPAEELLAYADEEAASYLVVGGRKRSPVGKALFGSVTQSVLLDAECPVLTVMGEN
ncbi:universal stress protein [Halorubrum sp. JWXQ-INN 858]|uniref:universal stress protein n=1 Tax=Halorubrum sp. JWXQ-INN 858 TaxID=2690782 RepID=UPI0013578EDD|nr:universal stress protein [Halorubrum sp. JWXQ-INN 858]MWV64568.1 universal stress protein [Halorubrum sp. JWXQ-INN 858]